MAVMQGAAASFSVAATGTAPLSYQWTRGGAAISGATSDSYTLPAATLADHNAAFAVTVSNSAGSAISNNATLAVTATAPALPTSTVCYPVPGATTCWALPRPFGNVVLDLQTLSATTWVVPTLDSILRTTDAGATWSVSTTPVSGFASAAAHFANTTVGLAVGSTDIASNQGAILRTTDGGATWTSVTVPGNVTRLLSVRFIDAGTAIAAANGQILRSTDGGVTWTVVFALTNADFQALANDNQLVLAVGGNSNKTARSVDGGATWQESASVGGYDISFGAAFVAVSTNGVTRRTSDGVMWTTIPSGTMQALRGVAFNPGNGNQVLAVGDEGTILRSTDAGQSWSSVASGVMQSLAVVKWASSMRAVAISEFGGVILMSDDAGLTWVRLGAGPAMLDDDLYAAAHNGADIALVGGSNGTIVRSIDDGNTWAAVVSGTTGQINALTFASPTVAVAVGEGGLIHRSTDSGATWMAVTSGTGEDLMDVHFASAAVGVAVGENGALQRTVDAGATWSAAATGGFTQSLSSVRFASADVAVAGSFTDVLRSTDGGATWTTISGVGGTIRFASASVGVAYRAGLDGYRTVDGGATWSVAAFPGAPQLLDFHSASAGRALFGDEFGSTADGGATWTLGAAAPFALFLFNARAATNAPGDRWIAVGDSGSVFVIAFQ
jgi:photosystem II stability/assembly factor-like uncharacterized protein